MKKTISNFILLLGFVFTANAQSITPGILNSAGGSNIVNSNTYEYSIGEMSVVSTNTAGSITITHGVLQPLTSKPESIDDLDILSMNINIYPNPTNNIIHIKVNQADLEMTTVQMMDVSGKLVNSWKSFPNNNQIIDLNIGEIANGIYNLRIFAMKDNQLHNSTFTIQKQ